MPHPSRPRSSWLVPVCPDLPRAATGLACPLQSCGPGLPSTHLRACTDSPTGSPGSPQFLRPGVFPSLCPAILFLPLAVAGGGPPSPKRRQGEEGPRGLGSCGQLLFIFPRPSRYLRPQEGTGQGQRCREQQEWAGWRRARTVMVPPWRTVGRVRPPD